MRTRKEIQKDLRTIQTELFELRETIDTWSLADAKKARTLVDTSEKLCDEIDALGPDPEQQRSSLPVSGQGGTPALEQDYRGFGEYLQSVARAGLPAGGSIGGMPTGVVDSKLLETRATGLAEALPSTGGFLVDSDYSRDLFRRVQKASVLFPRTRLVPISAASNSLKMPTLDETSRASGSRGGGILSYWLEESGTKTASKPKFGLLELSLKKLIGLCYSTDELLQDASALGAIIAQGFQDEFSFRIDDAILNGTGAGQPVGILNAACLVSQAKETGQAATTILWDNIKKMWARMHYASKSNAVWLINSDCLPQLMSMTQPVGTGGQSVWLPANQAAGRPESTLMGRPVLELEQCQTLGTVGDIYLADLSQYLTITKGGLQTAQSIHVAFTTDETVFRFVYRIDGQPMWSSALTPYKGSSNTQSPFIALATRS